MQRLQQRCEKGNLNLSSQQTLDAQQSTNVHPRILSNRVIDCRSDCLARENDRVGVSRSELNDFLGRIAFAPCDKTAPTTGIESDIFLVQQVFCQ